MTDFSFNSDKVDNPEVVSEFSMDDYEKYRLTQGEWTIDIAVVDLRGRNKEEYIAQRKEELSNSETEVPHPYRPEKKSDEDGEDVIDFSNLSGQGFADPEYNLVSDDDGGIVRYRYYVSWREAESGDKLMEIEVYTSKENSYSDLEEIAKSIKLG